VAKFSFRRGLGASSLRGDIERIKSLLFRYAREETIDPLRQLGRYSLFGCLGSILVGLGVVFALVGTLRILQDETGAFAGNLSWLPYVIVVLLAAVVIAVTLWRVVSGPAKRRGGKK